MMKQTKTLSIKQLITLAFTVAFAALLAGCNVQPAGMSTDEHAPENRQYMAQLNQKTEELNACMEKFQTAVSENNAVGIKAAAGEAAKVVESVKALESTESLAEVKTLYVEGLEAIQASMEEYAMLYSDVAAGKVSNTAFRSQIKNVQTSYSAAVEKLHEADELLTQLANE